MAAGDITPFMKHLKAQVDASTLASSPVDFDTDIIKIVILDNTFVPDTTLASIQEHFDDISAKEVATATAYTGPITLASLTVTSSGVVITFDAADVVVAADAGGFTDGRFIVFFKDSGTPSTSPLIAVGDLGADKDLTVGSLELTWASGGILTWSRV